MKKGRLSETELEFIQESTLPVEKIAELLDRSEAVIKKHRPEQPTQTASKDNENLGGYATQTKNKKSKSGVVIGTEVASEINDEINKNRRKPKWEDLNKDSVFRPKG